MQNLTVQVSGIDDKKDFDVVNKAMKMIGFTDRERETAWKLVAVIIHLVRTRTCMQFKAAFTHCD